MTNPELEEGWYWVRRSDEWPDEWRVAEFYDGLWWFTGSEVPASGANNDQIGPRLTPPQGSEER